MIKNLIYNRIKFIPDYRTAKITAEPGAVMTTMQAHVIKQSIDLTGYTISYEGSQILVSGSVNNISVETYEDASGIEHDTISGYGTFDIDDPHIKCVWGGVTAH